MEEFYQELYSCYSSYLVRRILMITLYTVMDLFLHVSQVQLAVYFLKQENASKKCCSGKWITYFIFCILHIYVFWCWKYKKSDIVHPFSHLCNERCLSATQKIFIIYVICLFLHLFPSVNAEKFGIGLYSIAFTGQKSIILIDSVNITA
jgi:hypothetical protein